MSILSRVNSYSSKKNFYLYSFLKLLIFFQIYYSKLNSNFKNKDLNTNIILIWLIINQQKNVLKLLNEIV